MRRWLCSRNVRVLVDRYNGATLTMTPDTATLKSSSGPLGLTGQTTLSLTSTTGSLTVSAAATDVKLLAPHATNGAVVLSAGDTLSVQSGGASTLTTTDTTATAGLTVVTGKASGGTSGAMSLSTSSATGGAAGSISFSCVSQSPWRSPPHWHSVVVPDHACALPTELAPPTMCRALSQ